MEPDNFPGPVIRNYWTGLDYINFKLRSTDPEPLYPAPESVFSIPMSINWFFPGPRRKFSRRGRRRGYRRYRRFRKRGRTSRQHGIKIPRTVYIPDYTLVKLKYQTSFTLNQGTVHYNQHLFRGNSLKDPDFTGGGHQPTGFDQWSVFYQKYCVTASKIRCAFFNQDATNNAGPVMVYVLPQKLSTFSPNGRDVTAQRYVKYRTLQETDASGGQGPGTKGSITSYMTTGAITGRSRKTVTTETDLSAHTNADPVQQWYWYCGVENLNNTILSTGMYCLVTITYYVKFYNPLFLGRS